MQTDWDIRLASLLLLALDTKDNFWQLYGDYLPAVDDSTSLLLASEVRMAFSVLKVMSRYPRVRVQFLVPLCTCKVFKCTD